MRRTPTTADLLAPFRGALLVAHAYRETATSLYEASRGRWEYEEAKQTLREAELRLGVPPQPLPRTA